MTLRTLFICSALIASLPAARAQLSNRPDAANESPGAIPLDSQGRPDVGPIEQASRMLGARVSAHGKKLGVVRDLALDFAEGYVALVVIEPAGTGTNQRIALPPYVLAKSGSEYQVSANVTAEMLAKLQRLPADDWVSKANRLWACQLYSEFRLRAPWEDRRGGTWGANSTYCQLYNPDQKTSIEGTIESVQYVAPQPGMALGTQLVVKTDKGPRSVQLGPLWFLSRGNVSFKPGERIRVIGSQIRLDGKPVMMASQVKVGDRNELRLRSEAGEVVWPGWSDDDDLFSFVPFTQWQGTAVANNAGEELGKLVDLAIGTQSGIIAYAALDHPVAGKDAYFPVPLSAFVAKPNASSWILELPGDVLQHTPTIPRANWPKKIDRGWVEYVHVRYGRSPFSGVRRETQVEAKAADASSS